MWNYWSLIVAEHMNQKLLPMVLLFFLSRPPKKKTKKQTTRTILSQRRLIHISSPSFVFTHTHFYMMVESWCFQRLVQLEAWSVLYRTLSLCSVCTFRDHAGLRLVPADVIEVRTCSHGCVAAWVDGRTGVPTNHMWEILAIARKYCALRHHHHHDHNHDHHHHHL